MEWAFSQCRFLPNQRVWSVSVCSLFGFLSSVSCSFPRESFVSLDGRVPGCSVLGVVMHGMASCYQRIETRRVFVSRSVTSLRVSAHGFSRRRKGFVQIKCRRQTVGGLLLPLSGLAPFLLSPDCSAEGL